MKCMSCESEINPKWKHAIDSNICPFCGQSVMEEQLKKLFVDLRLTMESLMSYPEQLNDWLLSNYDFIKTDSPNLPNYLPNDFLDKFMEQAKESIMAAKPQKDVVKDGKFTVKVKNDRGEDEEVLAEKIQTDERTSSFFKRAEAVRPNIDGFSSAAEKTQHLKNVANQIKKAGSLSVVDNGFVSPEMMEQADPEAIAEMQRLMSEGESNVSSSLAPPDDDEIPSIVLAMANKGRNKGSSSANSADLMKLQQMHDRVSNSRKNFESGENRGKGGFSRSG